MKETVNSWYITSISRDVDAINRTREHMKKKNIGRLLYCISCENVWEKFYSKEFGSTMTKYPSLCSYKLTRKKCIECKGENDG